MWGYSTSFFKWRQLREELSPLSLKWRVLLVTIFSNYTCTKNGKNNYASLTWLLVCELGMQVIWCKLKKIYSPTTTYANQNLIIPFCLFYLELQNKISHDYVLLKVVMLFFQRQILFPLPYKLVASYIISYILLVSYFLSRTRTLLFSKNTILQCYFLFNSHQV